MIQRIENEKLEIKVNQIGAELCSIRSKATGKEYMWNAQPDVWGSHAPVLFPVIGQVREEGLLYKGMRYAIPRHGFVRNNPNLACLNESKSLTFRLAHSEGTRKVYPFEFIFDIKYLLVGSKIMVEHTVKNLSKDELYFSLGAHPAFNCPINDDEVYEDYFLEFEHVENSPTWKLDNRGLVSTISEPCLVNTKKLDLHKTLFNDDALILKDLKSRIITLKSNKSSQQVKVQFNDFPYVGIWAKPGAPFVCIEPWLGIADTTDADGSLEHKEGIIRLEGTSSFSASYSIEIIE